MFRKILFVATAIITIAGILSSFIVLYSKRNDDGLKIEDVSGNRSVLNDVIITGTLADYVQRNNFVYQNNNFTKTYSSVNDDSIAEYLFNKQNPKDLINLWVDKSFIIPDDSDKQTSTRTDEQGRKITETTSNKAVISLDVNGDILKTDIIVYADQERFRQFYQDNGNGTAIGSNIIGKDIGIDTHDLLPVSFYENKYFLFTTTGADCTGFGGIYEIKIIDGKRVVSKENLAPLDLKDGRVQIVGMKASKNWFVYITVENEKVVLKPFSRDAQSFVNEITINQLPKYAKSNSSYDGSEEHSIYQITHVFYNASIQDEQIFNIEIVDKDADNLPKSSFYAVNLNENKILLSYQEKTTFYNSRDGQYTYSSNDSSETVMKYKNNRMYVLRKYIQLLYPIPDNENSAPLSSVHISVFENGRSVYEGEIGSAAKDDYIYQGPPMYKAYGKTYMRGFYFLGID